MAKTTTAVAAGIIKLAVSDIDQAIIRLRTVQQDVGPNVVLTNRIDRLVEATRDLDKFADKLRG